MLSLRIIQIKFRVDVLVILTSNSSKRPRREIYTYFSLIIGIQRETAASEANVVGKLFLYWYLYNILLCILWFIYVVINDKW